MDLLISFDVGDAIAKNRGLFYGRPDQRRIMDALKINFDYVYDNFMEDDMFFYEIPTPLEI